MKNPFASLPPADAYALRRWGEHETPVLPAIVARLEAAGFVRVLHLKTEAEPVNMLTTAGMEKRDQLREEWAARQAGRAGP